MRTAALKELCASVGEEYHQIIGNGETRFLALRTCIDSIIHIFNGLKEFFLKSSVSPNILKDLNTQFLVPSVKNGNNICIGARTA